jgi:hypothetical protein
MKVPFLAYMAIFVQGVVAVLGGFYYKSLPNPLKLLTWLLGIIFLESIASFILALLNIHNLWLSHVNTIIEFVLLVAIYFLWMKSRYVRSLMFICLIAFCVIWIISKFTFESFSQVDGWTTAISKIFQIVFSAFMLVEVIKEDEIIWMNDQRFWVAAGVIIYSAGSLFMFALFNEMLHVSPRRLLQIYSINWVLLIISNLFYARGFLCKK